MRLSVSLAVAFVAVMAIPGDARLTLRDNIQDGVDDAQNCYSPWCSLDECTENCNCYSANCDMPKCTNHCNCALGHCDQSACTEHCTCFGGWCNQSECTNNCGCSAGSCDQSKCEGDACTCAPGNCAPGAENEDSSPPGVEA